MFNYEMKLVLGVAALNNEIAIVQAKKPQTITLPWHQVYCYTYLVDGVHCLKLRRQALISFHN
jgi:hypothetical protein